MKTCNKCFKSRPLSHYVRDKYRPDGFKSTCRECYNPTRFLRWLEREALKEDGLKKCPKCGEIKKLNSDFPRRNSPGDPSYCKPCQAEWGRRYRKDNRSELNGKWREQRQKRIDKNPDKEAYLDFKHRLKYMYSISVERYEYLLEAQGGVCGICGKAPEGRRLAVDHDHSCCPGSRSCGSCVRGLLCTSCNPKLGFYEVNREKIELWLLPKDVKNAGNS